MNHDYACDYHGRITLYATAREAQAAAREAVQISEGRTDTAIADATRGDHYVYRRVGRSITRKRRPGNIIK